jgi:thiamine-phosphate pyrophosphorylase
VNVESAVLNSRFTIHDSRLHAILDVDVAAARGWPVVDLARAFLDGGAPVVQLRAKRLASGPFLEYCDHIVTLAAACGATFIVNDRADLAKMSGAAGVHVGQEDLAPAAARALLGPAAVIGYSTHTVAQIEAALAEPVTYIAVGPVFGTRTKDTGYDAVGLELVTEAVRRARGRPVVAIGGITLANAASVIGAGAAGVAVITDLLSGPDPSRRVSAYLQATSQL